VGDQAERRSAELDDAVIKAVRRRLGIPKRNRQRPHNEFVTLDAVRHFALGYGDDNPLWCDQDYGRTSVWGDVVAPPMFPTSAGIPVPVTWTLEEQEAMAGGDPLAGLGQNMCGERWVFLRPVQPGAQLTKSESIDAAELKRSAFGGGLGALVSHRVEFRSKGGDGGLVSVRYLDFWHTQRERSGAAGKYRDIEPTSYTPASLAELDRLYEEEAVRGPEPRPWESVEVGDSLGTIAKGPLTLTDIITYHVAIGWGGGYGGGTGKVAYNNRKRIPKFYIPNAQGVPDSAQRCHWDSAWAQHLGHPAAYDYGAMRTNWMIHLITNWMGDSGWLWKLSAAVTKFNYVADAHRISGAVTGVRGGSGTGEVELSIEGSNQRGETTCRATATVLLGLSGARTPALPDPEVLDVPQAAAP